MIAVGGSTGNVGRRLVTRLRAMNYPVRALLAPGEAPPWPPGDDLEIVEADFAEPPSLRRALMGAEAYFLMSPVNEFQMEWQRAQVEAAASVDVDRVVKLSAYESGLDSDWQLSRWHWDGEVALRESGLTHAVLRPQYFHQNLMVPEQIVRAGTMITYIPPDEPFGNVHAGDVADVAAVLLTTEPLTGQIVVPTAGELITTQDASDAISAALGIEIAIDYVDPERARRELSASGQPDWLISDLIKICLKPTTGITDDVVRLTGHRARTIAEAAMEQFGVRTRNQPLESREQVGAQTMSDRLAQLTIDQLDDEQRKLWTAIAEGSRGIPGVNESGHLVGPYDVLLRSPEVGILLSRLGSGLRRQTGLPSRLIELSILGVAAHWRCGYQWLVHAEVARKLGIGSDVISAIQAGRVPDFADQSDQAAYRYSTELLRTGSIDCKTFEAGRDLLGDAGAVELITFTGHYTVVAFVLNSFDVPLSGPAPRFGDGRAEPHPGAS